MPCTTPVCSKCNKYECPGFDGGPCKFSNEPKQEKLPEDWEARFCEAMDAAYENIPFKNYPENLKTLWRTHTEKEQDRIRKDALSKLTKREKEALGLLKK